MLKALLGQYVSTKERNHNETRNHPKTAESPPTEAHAIKTALRLAPHPLRHSCQVLAIKTHQISCLVMQHVAQERTWPPVSERGGGISGILHRNDVTARGKGSGDAWDVSARDQLGESPDTKRLDPMSQEGKPGMLEGKIGLQHEVDGRSGKSSRYSRDCSGACDGSQMEEYHTRDATQGCLVQQMVRRINIWERVHCRWCDWYDTAQLKFGWRTGRVGKQSSRGILFIIC